MIQEALHVTFTLMRKLQGMNLVTLLLSSLHRTSCLQCSKEIPFLLMATMVKTIFLQLFNGYLFPDFSMPTAVSAFICSSRYSGKQLIAKMLHAVISALRFTKRFLNGTEQWNFYKWCVSFIAITSPSPFSNEQVGPHAHHRYSEQGWILLIDWLPFLVGQE